MATIEEKIKNIVIEQLDEEYTDPKTTWADLGADSLDKVELVMCLEEEFDLEIPDDDAEKICSPQDAIEYVRKCESQERRRGR